MKRFGLALLWAMGAYLLGAFGGGWLLSEFSSNIHDRSVEAAMTGAFFFGPALALLAFIVAMVWRRPAPERDIGDGSDASG